MAGCRGGARKEEERDNRNVEIAEKTDNNNNQNCRKCTETEKILMPNRNGSATISNIRTTMETKLL